MKKVFDSQKKLKISEEERKSCFYPEFPPKPMILSQVEPIYNGKIIKNKYYLLD